MDDKKVESCKISGNSEQSRRVPKPSRTHKKLTNTYKVMPKRETVTIKDMSIRETKKLHSLDVSVFESDESKQEMTERNPVPMRILKVN